MQKRLLASKPSDLLTTDRFRRNNQPTMRPACWPKMRVLPTRPIGLTSRSQTDGLTNRRNAGLTNPFDRPNQPIAKSMVLPTVANAGLTNPFDWPYQLIAKSMVLPTVANVGLTNPHDWPYQPITETWLTLLSQSLKVWPGLLTQPGPALFYRPRPQREEKSKSHIPRTADILLHSPESCVFCRFYVAHRKWAKTPELLHF